jgi:DNA-binding transcriptional ArsR family regulator
MTDSDAAVVAECQAMAETWAPVRPLGNQDRLLIVHWLAGTDGSVRHLEKVTGLSQSLVSYHLAELRKSGLVTATAVGRTNRYALSRPELDSLAGLLCGLDATGNPTV